MKVFLSWSGERSKAFAAVLRDWLPLVVPSAEPWFSPADIGAGRRWNLELQSELEDSHFGVLCVTRANSEAPWLLFEAGAIAKSVKQSHVCPLVLGAAPTDLPPGPLNQFQAFAADRDGVRHVVRTLNAALELDAEPEARVDKRFDNFWSELETALSKIPPEKTPTVSKRTQDQKLDEVLEIVRQLSRVAGPTVTHHTDPLAPRIGPSTMDLPKDDPSAQHIRQTLLERLTRGWLQAAFSHDSRLSDRGIQVSTIQPRKDGVAVTFVCDDTVGGAFLRGPAPWEVPGNQFDIRVAEPLVQKILDAASIDNQSGQRSPDEQPGDGSAA